MVNDLASRDSACARGDPDTGRRAGRLQPTRIAAAEALVDWLATDPTHDGDPAVLCWET